MKPNIRAFFEPQTSTISYVVYDEIGGFAVIIDPVLDFNSKSGEISSNFADKIISFIEKIKVKVKWILETHVHADHVSAAYYLQQKLGAKIGISKNISCVQDTFKKIFNLSDDFKTDGSQFDYLFSDEEYFQVGKLTFQALFVSGHTPSDTAYVVDDAIFVGDTIFMPDVGTARCDFPNGNAKLLYHSIQKLLSFADDTRLFMCHDYPPTNRDIQWQSSVLEQKRFNIHVNTSIDEQSFVNMRKARDKTLEMPALIWPSIQINIAAGRLPKPESNNISYLKIPLKSKL